MPIRTSRFLTGLLLLFGMTALAHATSYKITTFTYPGATSTVASGINNGNVIVGSYIDSAGASHGFRLSGSTFTAINFPGAAQTAVFGINDLGDMVGWYALPGENPGAHGFERHADGTFTTITGPNGIAVGPTGINKAGTIVGSYTNNSNNTHGFILKNGTFTTFDAPEQSGEIPDTSLNGINNLGDFVGQVFTGDNWRGFWVTGSSSDLDFAEALFSTDNQILGIDGHGNVVGCHDNGGAFLISTPESGESSESAESFPTEQPISGLSNACANSINYAGDIVGAIGTPGSTQGFLATPTTAGLSVAISSPVNGSTVANPVHVVASASGPNPIQFMQVWVNGSKVYQAAGSSIDTSLTLPTGSNIRFVVQAVDSTGATAKQVESINVTAGTSETVNISSPEDGSVITGHPATVSNPVRVIASASGSASVSHMEVWVNGSKKFQVSGSSVNTSLTLPQQMNDRLVVEAVNSSGVVVGKTTEIVNVNGTGSSSAMVTITLPVWGLAAADPVHVVGFASGSAAVNHLEVWFNGTKEFQAAGSSVDTSINLPVGDTNFPLTLESVDSSGHVLAKATVIISVVQ